MDTKCNHLFRLFQFMPDLAPLLVANHPRIRLNFSVLTVLLWIAVVCLWAKTIPCWHQYKCSYL